MKKSENLKIKMSNSEKIKKSKNLKKSFTCMEKAVE